MSTNGVDLNPLNSTLGKAVKNSFTDVSLQKPFGNSAIGQLGGSVQNGLGIKNLQDRTGFTNNNLINFNPVKGSNNIDTQPQSSQIYAEPNTGLGAGAAPVYQDVAAENAFRDAYMKSLTPNTNFNINAQGGPGNQFKAITPGSIGPSGPSVAGPK